MLTLTLADLGEEAGANGVQVWERVGVEPRVSWWRQSPRHRGQPLLEKGVSSGQSQRDQRCCLLPSKFTGP